MVPLSRVDLLRPVQLLQNHHAGQLVRKRHRAHGELLVSPLQHIFPQPQAPADHKHDPADSRNLHFFQMLRQLLRRPALPADRHRDDPVACTDLAEDRFAFLGFDLLFQRFGRNVEGIKIVRLNDTDIVRNSLVARIVKAYDNARNGKGDL